MSKLDIKIRKRFSGGEVARVARMFQAKTIVHDKDPDVR